MLLLYRTLDSPLLVMSGTILLLLFSFVSGGQTLGCIFRPFPEEEISDYIVHGPIIGVLTVDSQSLATLCYIG